MPLAIPLAAAGVAGNALDPAHAERVLLATAAAVLSGAVFGDHCSPISDTTIMSSLASASDHVDHVRTQLPYALAGSAITILAGYGGLALGLDPWVSLPAGGALLIAMVYFLGRSAENDSADPGS